jgi:hypothetical protein
MQDFSAQYGIHEYTKIEPELQDHIDININVFTRDRNNVCKELT